MQGQARRGNERRCGGRGRRTPAAVAALAFALLAGCASGPERADRSGAMPPSERDGPEPNPPADLVRVPDAEPRLEPIRSGGPNKPYDALGQSYVPITQDAPYAQRGLASWYGRKFQGKRTSSGEPYDMYAMTAAHPTLPIPSYARVRNPANGREVVVRINDRGPFHSTRIVDLSYTAALKLDLLRGVAPVELQRITFDEIRSGAWRRDGGAGGSTAAALAPAAATTAVSRAAVSAAAAAAAPPVAVTAPVAATTALPRAAVSEAAPPSAVTAPSAATTTVHRAAVLAATPLVAVTSPVMTAAVTSAATPATGTAVAPPVALTPAAPSAWAAGTSSPPAVAQSTTDPVVASRAITDPANVVSVASIAALTAIDAGRIEGAGAAASAPPTPPPPGAPMIAATAPAAAAATAPPPATAPTRGFWVQLGAFRARDAAETFQQHVASELTWLSPLLAVFGDAALYRLQAGPYATRDDARGAAERVRNGLKLVPLIVERR